MGRRALSGGDGSDCPCQGWPRPPQNSRMVEERSDLRVATAAISICLAIAGCGRANQWPIAYTAQPGRIDDRPDALWGAPYPHMPPDPRGRPFDPTQGLGVRGFADRLIGRHIADFVGHRWDMLRSGVEVSDFYPHAKAGPGPGMCEARRFQITGGFSGSRVVRTSDGQWSSPVYAVAGSLAPTAAASTKDYRRRLGEACKERSDMDMWFSAEPQSAYLGARLADAAVAAARRQGSLPFRLTCTPYPPDVRYRPQCVGDARGTIASINPRAILEVGECHEKAGPECISVQLAKVPERSTQIEDRWTLDIRFDRTNGFRIKDVALADTQLIID